MMRLVRTQKIICRRVVTTPTQTLLPVVSATVDKRDGFHTTMSTDCSTKPPTLAARAVAAFPPGAQPFLKLVRMDRPIGSWLLFWPCGWSLGMAAPAGSLPDPSLLATFAVGAIIMRGAGCTINDMWDADLDRRVTRTKDRPITSGQMSQFDALVFLGGQLGAATLLLTTMSWYTVCLGAASMALVVTYPLMKRVTYWPQLMLGLTFNWGALVGWSAVHGVCDWSVCLPLYLAGVSWTLLYDTIYAHQDKYDDIAVGIKSTALRFADNTKPWLTAFGASMVGCLIVAGVTADMTWPFYLSLAGISGHLAHQVWTLDINNPEDCGEKFRSNRKVGLILFLGIISGTMLKKGQQEDKQFNNGTTQRDIEMDQ